MNIIKIAILAISAVLIALQFKSSKSEYGIYIILVVSMFIFFYGIERISQVIGAIDLVKNKLSVSGEYIEMLIKIVGVSYICEFSSDICKDSGYGAIANQIQIFGKLSILVISTPVYLSLFDVIDRLM